MRMEIRIRTFDELSKEELYAIVKTRIAVFVVEQNCPYQEIDNTDKEALHVFIQEGEKIEAYLRLFPKEEGVVQMGRVLAVPHGEGLGRMIVEEAIRVIRERKDIRQIYIEAQTYATGFYEKFGFRICSDEFLEDDIPHVGMTLDL